MDIRSFLLGFGNLTLSGAFLTEQRKLTNVHRMSISIQGLNNVWKMFYLVSICYILICLTCFQSLVGLDYFT